MICHAVNEALHFVVRFRDWQQRIDQIGPDLTIFDSPVCAYL